ncbi:hypothetical protein [Carnobacterium sp.]
MGFGSLLISFISLVVIWIKLSNAKNNQLILKTTKSYP